MSRLLPVLSAVALLGLSGCLKSVETEHELPTATADTSSTSSVVLFDVEETESSTKDERAQNSESGAGQNVQNEPTEVHDLKQSTEAQTPQPDVGGYVDQHEFADQEDFDGDMGLDSLDPIRPSPELHTGRDKAIQISGGVSTSRNSRHRHQAHKKPKAKQKSDASAVSAPPSLPVGGLFVPADPPPPPIVREAVTENYTDYGVNGFELSERDNLSTFAVDVDTASYTITRRKLTEGYLPPTSAVRVEEFVNYFPYEYTQPKPGDPFAVDMEASPSPYNPTNHIVRVGVQGKKVSFDSRKAVHLTFLVDVSGSMQSRDKMGMVKDSLKMLTQELEDGDTVAIATYAGATKIVLNPTPMSRKADIIRALDGLTAGGSTAMGAGIDLAYGLADASYRDGSVNRVIVCSDGDANVGQISHAQLSNKIKGYANKGITLTTIGFGNGNYNDTMMERLANDGDGNYFYIDSLKESRRIFIDKLSSTLEVIAKDVKIQVEWNNEAVIANRLIGYDNPYGADSDFRNDAVDAGEIGAGHQVTAIYEVALADHPTGSLGTVRIRNKAPGPDAPAVERSYNLPVSAIHDSFAASSEQLRIQVASMGFAEILRDSPHMNEISLRFVADIARGAQRVEYHEDAELVRLIERAAQLKGERSMVAR